MADREASRIRIVLADDHALLVEALTLILESVGDVVATAKDGVELVKAVEMHGPDLVITDLSMPGGSGFAALRAIRVLPTAPPVIVLTVHEDPGTRQAAELAGAAGYVVKSAPSKELLGAVHAAMRRKPEAQSLPSGGGSCAQPAPARAAPAVAEPAVADPAVADPEGTLLTPRQHAVLQGLAEGLTSRQIAERLGISERTVVFHREGLRARLGVRTPQEMLLLLHRISG